MYVQSGIKVSENFIKNSYFILIAYLKYKDISSNTFFIYWILRSFIGLQRESKSFLSSCDVMFNSNLTSKSRIHPELGFYNFYLFYNFLYSTIWVYKLISINRS